MKKRSNLDRCTRVLKTVFIILNVAFALFGVAVMASGVYISVDKLHFTSSVFGIPIIAASSYFFESAGSLLLVISIVGCMGALYEKRSLLFVYALVLFIVFMLAFTAASLALVFRSWVREQVKTYMRATLQNYYGVDLNNSYNARVTEDWDKAQQKWYCCAVEDESWGVYRSSEWYAVQPGIRESTKPYVPQSCCRKNQYGKFLCVSKCQINDRGPPSKQSPEHNECLYYKGCWERGQEELYKISAYLIIMGLIVCLVVLAGITISLYLFRRV